MRSKESEAKRRAAAKVAMAKRYHDRKAAGLCVSCGGARDGSGLSCNECAEIVRAKTARYRKRNPRKNVERYESLKNVGLCTKCGDSAVIGKTLCLSCAAKVAERCRHRNATVEGREDNKRRGADRYVGLKRDGLCVLCKNPTGAKRIMCDNCRMDYNAKQCVRRAEDIQFGLRMNLRTRFYAAIKRYLGGAKRVASHVKDLGCTIEEFCTYMEERFTPGMSWENHGQWHIDHIRPLVSFDLTDPEQQKQAVHFSNMQPLWAAENLSENDGYDN